MTKKINKKNKENSNTEKKNNHLKRNIIISCSIIGIIALVIVIIICTKNLKKDNQVIELNNIEGKYSDVVINDFTSAKESLKDIKDLLTVDSIDDDLVEIRSHTNDSVMNSYKMKQIYNGIEVYDGSLIVYADSQGNALGVINNLKEINDLNTEPINDSNELKAIALDSVDSSVSSITDSKLIIYQLENNQYTLAYSYEIKTPSNDYKVIVSDSTKEVLKKISLFDNITDNDYIISDTMRKILRNTYSETVNYDDYKYAIVDEKRNLSVGRTQNITDDSDYFAYLWNKEEERNNSDFELAFNSLKTIQKIYDFYSENFNYLSVDGANKNHISILTGVEKIDGQDFTTNAGFNSNNNRMALGSNNLHNENVEVLGHEYTHGIIHNQIGDTGKGYPEFEAFNEGFADIMGMCIEAYYNNSSNIDGKMGNDRDITSSTAKYDNWVHLISDDEYVNSTIISRSAYIMSKSLTLDELTNLWFKSIDLLEGNIGFYDVKYAVVNTAYAMKLSDDKINAIKQAFADVGLDMEVIISLNNRFDYTESEFKINIDIKPVYAEYAEKKSSSKNNIEINPELKDTYAFVNDDDKIIALKEDGSEVVILDNGDSYGGKVEYADGKLYFYKMFGKASKGTPTNGPVNKQKRTITSINYYELDLTQGDGNYKVEEIYKYTPTSNYAIESPVVYNGYLYFAKNKNQLIKFDIANKTEEIIYTSPYEATISIIADKQNGLLYFLGNITNTSKELYVYDMNSNKTNKIDVADPNVFNQITNNGLYFSSIYYSDTSQIKKYFYDAKNKKVNELTTDENVNDGRANLYHKNNKIYYLDFKDLTIANLIVIENNKSKIIKENIDYGPYLEEYGNNLLLAVNQENYLVNTTTDEITKIEKTYRNITFIK